LIIRAGSIPPVWAYNPEDGAEDGIEFVEEE